MDNFTTPTGNLMISGMPMALGAALMLDYDAYAYFNGLAEGEQRSVFGFLDGVDEDNEELRRDRVDETMRRLRNRERFD